MHLQHQISMFIKIAAGAEECLISEIALLFNILMLDSFNIICLYYTQDATYWVYEYIYKKQKKKKENKHRVKNVIKNLMKKATKKRMRSLFIYLYKSIIFCLIFI